MKKKRFAGLLVLAPMCLLAACGGGVSALTITPNWYSDTTTGSIEETSEELEYKVVYSKPTNKEQEYYVEYDEGTYVTKLSSLAYSYSGDGGKTETVYSYSTELNISGRYIYKNKSQKFSDCVTSHILFRSAKNDLIPLSSSKNIKSTNAVSKPNDNVLCEEFTEAYTITYNTAASASEELSLATVHNDAPQEGESESAEDTEVKLKYKGTFLDNEEILFAFRGLSMDEAVSFSSINIQDFSVIGVEFTGVPTDENVTISDLIINGETVSKEIGAKVVKFRYDSPQPGATRTAYYAAKTDAKKNEYRNVMLKYYDPLPDNGGSFEYTLKKATFHA